MNGNTIQIEIKLKDDGTIKKIRDLGDQGQRTGDKLDKGFKKGGQSIGFFNKNVVDLAKGFAVAQLAMTAGREGVRLFRQEITLGLEAVEDLNVKVASMSAFISTFSQTTKDGDIAGGFEEAYKYATALIPRLEVLDARTVATGKDLTIMAETMAMNGVLLDVNNKKQEDGFVNIANALKLVTAGQNQDIQMRQEINSLMLGQIRMTDRLPKLLQAVDPQLKSHLEIWKQEGTVIENVGELLKGFGASADLISSTWMAIGSTMETIHTRVLRGGMTPMYEDLLDLATDLNRSIMDQNGDLTENGRLIQGMIATGWVDVKNTLGVINNLIGAFEGPLTLVGDLTGMIFDGWGQIMAMLGPVSKVVGLIGQSMWKDVEAMVQLTSGDFSGAKTSFAAGGSLMGQAMAINLRDEFEKELNEYYAARDIGSGITAGTAIAPKMAPGMSSDQLKAAQKAAGARLKMERDLTSEIKQLTLEEYEYKKWALDKEVNDLWQKAGQEMAVQDTVIQYETAKTLELERERLEGDQKLLSKRLADYEKFYDDIGRQIDAHAKKEKQNILDLNNLYRQQMNLRRSTEEMLAGLGKVNNVDPLKQYQTTKAELDQQFQAAQMLGGQDQIDALEKYKQAINSLAQEFEGGAGYLAGDKITGQAIQDIERAYEIQKQLMAEMTAASEKQIETNKIWGQELQAEAELAAVGIYELQDTIYDLDDQLAAMDKVIALEGEDLASSVVRDIQREVDLLHDKTITITTNHIDNYGGGGSTSVPVLDSYATGTDWVPKTGPYLLHEGEGVSTVAENRVARSVGGGANKKITFGDINIYNQGGGGASQDMDLRRQVRDELMPEILEQLRNA
ncbi:MAG: hypothetical protein ABFS18_02175 [Thermodesulfobacteriota bacterium]